MLRTLFFAVVAFVSTNIDDLLVLVALFANQRLSRPAVVLGQVAGIVTLAGASLCCAMLALALPAQYLRYLGILPVIVGSLHLLRQVQRRNREDEQHPDPKGVGVGLQVALVTIANGGDNIAVYVPLFTRQPVTAIATTWVVFAVMTGVWCALAYGLTSHPRLRTTIGQRGHQVLPFLLIGLGLFILGGY